MANTTTAMMRYRASPGPLVVQLKEVVEAYLKRYGQPPTLAHVSLSHQQVPSRIGPIRIERAWGLYPAEIDLGLDPETQSAPQPLRSALPDTTQPS